MKMKVYIRRNDTGSYQIYDMNNIYSIGGIHGKAMVCLCYALCAKEAKRYLGLKRHIRKGSTMTGYLTLQFTPITPSKRRK